MGESPLFALQMIRSRALSSATLSQLLGSLIGGCLGTLWSGRYLSKPFTSARCQPSNTLRTKS